MRWAEADKIGKIDFFSPEIAAFEQAREQSARLADKRSPLCVFCLSWRFAKEIQRCIWAPFAKHQVRRSRSQWEAAICLYPLSQPVQPVVFCCHLSPLSLICVADGIRSLHERC